MHKNSIITACLILMSLALFPAAAFARYHNICFDCHIMHSSKGRSAIITYPLNYLNDFRICSVTNGDKDGSAAPAGKSPKKEKKAVKSKSTIVKGSCIKCHGAEPAYKVVGSGGKIVSPFVRHPSDVVMPKSGEYRDYQQILNSRNADDPVICLSCHLLHNQVYNKWDYNAIMATDNGCSLCHEEQD